MTKELPAEKKVITESEAAYALKHAYARVFGSDPSQETLAILLGQTALETGRFKVGFWDYNWGNIKASASYDGYIQFFECSEIINGREIFFKPPHPQCRFRAYLTPTDGAVDYIHFLTGSRYAKALVQLKAGKVVEYTTELKKAGYFTANLTKYILAMKSLYSEFMKKLDNGLMPPEPQPAAKIPARPSGQFYDLWFPL